MHRTTILPLLALLCVAAFAASVSADEIAVTGTCTAEEADPILDLWIVTITRAGGSVVEFLFFGPDSPCESSLLVTFEGAFFGIGTLFPDPVTLLPYELVALDSVTPAVSLGPEVWLKGECSIVAVGCIGCGLKAIVDLEGGRTVEFSGAQESHRAFCDVGLTAIILGVFSGIGTEYGPLDFPYENVEIIDIFPNL